MLLVAALGFTGCSDDEPSSRPSQSPSPSPTVIVSIGDAISGVREDPRATALTLEVTHSPDNTQTLTGEGFFAGEIVELVIDGSEATNEAGIFGELDSFGAAFSGTDAFFEVLPGTPSWLSVSLEEASRTEGRDIAQLRELALANPNVLLTLFKRVDAEGPIGPNEIDGEPMARFDVPLSMGGAWPPTVQPLADVLLEDFGIEDIEVHLWVDAENRLRRIEESFAYPLVLSGGPDVEVSITIDLSAEPVDESPELPDDSDVRSLEELAS